MKIAVLNGSPKGPKSVTMQYVAYLQKKHPQHEFVQLDVAHRVRKLEADEAAFSEVLEQVRAADGVLWAFPLYYMLVCSQYKRFIELVFERGAQEAFAGKHAAALATSIHFYDHTALDYIQAIAEDLGMRFVGCHSAAMNDLFSEPGRRQFELFGEDLAAAISEDRPAGRTFPPIARTEVEYRPGPRGEQVATGGRRVLVLTDVTEPQSNLQRMIDRFVASLDGAVEVLNLHEVDIKGGCTGCCKCALDNHCIYDGKDGYRDFLESKVKTADVLVFAGTVVDRYLSSKWKQYFDRSFYNGHTPTTPGGQVGFIISGPMSQLSTTRQILQAYAEFQGCHLVDIVTDESGDGGQVDALLSGMAGRLMRYAQNGYIPPSTFLRVGGMKLFRDEIWGPMRVIFQADYAYYKRHGLFDFPQGNWKTRLMNAVLVPLTRIPAVRKRFRDQCPDAMLGGYPKLLEKV